MQHGPRTAKEQALSAQTHHCTRKGHALAAGLLRRSATCPRRTGQHIAAMNTLKVLLAAAIAVPTVGCAASKIKQKDIAEDGMERQEDRIDRREERIDEKQADPDNSEAKDERLENREDRLEEREDKLKANDGQPN